MPCSAGDAIRLPSTVTPLIKPVPADVRHESDGPTTSIGCMAYLQESLDITTLQSQLKILLHLGGAKQPKIPTSRSGRTDILNGIVIPFQDPLLM